MNDIHLMAGGAKLGDMPLDEHLNAAYMDLVKKSKAKNPTQAVNSSIGRTVGRIYKLKGTGIMRTSLVKMHSRLRKTI